MYNCSWSIYELLCQDARVVHKGLLVGCCMKETAVSIEHLSVLHAEPSPYVLNSLANMYTTIIQPNPKLRPKILKTLLTPLHKASSLADPDCASADVQQLSFCVHFAAALPCKRADEPLMLIHCINSIISRVGHEVLDRQRAALIQAGYGQKLGLTADEEAEEAAGRPISQPADARAASDQNNAGDEDVCDDADVSTSMNGANGVHKEALSATHDLVTITKASLALSMLLVLKQYLMAAYWLADDRVACFELKGDKKRQEVSDLCSTNYFTTLSNRFYGSACCM